MAYDTMYGYREGARSPVQALVATGGTFPIKVGDLISISSGGYVSQAAAGDVAFGVAMAQIDTDPGTNGYATLLVDTSQESIYEYPPDAGTVSQALVGKTCDVGGAKSINIDASADDCILIVAANTDRNTVRIQLKTSYTGVA